MLEIEIKRKTLYRCTLLWGGWGSAYTDDFHYEFYRLFEEEKLPTIARYFEVTFEDGGDDYSECSYEAQFTSPNKDNLVALKHWFDNPTLYPALTEMLKPIDEAITLVAKLDKDGYLVTYVDIDEEIDND